MEKSLHQQEQRWTKLFNLKNNMSSGTDDVPADMSKAASGFNNVKKVLWKTKVP